MKQIGMNKENIKKMVTAYCICMGIGFVFYLSSFMVGIFSGTIISWCASLISLVILFFKAWNKNKELHVQTQGQVFFMYLVGWVGCIALDIFIVAMQIPFVIKFVILYKIIFFFGCVFVNVIWYFFQREYPETAKYLVAGVATSLITFFSYILFAKVILLSKFVSQIISWVLALIFAFFVNKIWVFTSKTDSFKAFILEFLNFASGRLVTLVVFELALFMFLVQVVHMNDIVAKLLVTVAVVVANYVWGKWLTFKKPKEK